MLGYGTTTTSVITVVFYPELYHQDVDSSEQNLFAANQKRDWVRELQSELSIFSQEVRS
jgi:hypothetical protein